MSQTRIIITTAAAALTLSLAAPAQAYGTAPDSSITPATAPGDMCDLGPTAQLVSILNLPESVIATC